MEMAKFENKAKGRVIHHGPLKIMFCIATCYLIQ